jgi:ABC-type transport system involved in multi-copper enzyme maturation permease subunit
MNDVGKPLVPRGRRLDPFEAVFQVAQLTVKRAFKGSRAFIAVAVVLLPAGIGLLARGGGADAGEQEEFFYGMLGVYHFGIAVPFVALLFATGFPWPEAEEGTLTYWFTSPVPRWTVLLGRWAASLVVGAVILSLGVVSIGAPLSLRPEAELGGVMRSAVACTLLAYPAYLAGFQLFTTWSRWGLVVGVLFILIENFVSLISGAIVLVTLLFYVRCFFRPSIPDVSRNLARDVFEVYEPASVPGSIAVLIGAALACLALSLLLVSTIEYRGKSAQTS